MLSGLIMFLLKVFLALINEVKTEPMNEYLHVI